MTTIVPTPPTAPLRSDPLPVFDDRMFALSAWFGSAIPAWNTSVGEMTALQAQVIATAQLVLTAAGYTVSLPSGAVELTSGLGLGGTLKAPTVLAGGLTAAMTNAGTVQAKGGISNIAASASASSEVKAVAYDWFAGSYSGITMRYNGASTAGNLTWLPVAKSNVAEIDFTNCDALAITTNLPLASFYIGFAGVKALKVTQAGIEQQSVLSPTLINTWANSGGSYVAAGYWKDPFGNVHLRGAVTGGAAGSVAFVLPAGYRPALTMMLPGIGNSAATNTYIAIDSAGNVTLGAVGRMHLDGVIFRAA